ncbi:alpha,alpha-trehalose-phosphate synthase (UDP-forming) [Caldiplasma sukawensis]
MTSLIMVTSRGPYSYERGRTGTVKKFNVGGVATGLKAVMEKYGGVWVFWGDGSMDKDHLDEMDGNYRIKRIMLDLKERRGYYDAYSNSTLWPLFHYFREKIKYNSSSFKDYKRVNRKFCDEVLSTIEDKAQVIWIHDYQLSLLPGMLRERGVENKIIFTWHIPWVSSEFYSNLPERNEIVRSISMSDSVTFHTEEYVKNFKESYFRIVGRDKNIENKVHAIPLGIDFMDFQNFNEKKENLKGQMRIIFSIDRLDYTKGLIQRLLAIEHFIINYPEFKGKFTYVMIVTPSRSNIEGYAELKDELEKNVGRINGLYGSVEWVPIIYMYRKINRRQLLSYYSSCDIALITPLKDGLNLVAEEFIASTKNGVLIISEFTGVSNYLDGVLKVNPNSPEDVAEKIWRAMHMDDSERQERLQSMKKFLKRHDYEWWVKKVLSTVGIKDVN